MIPRTASALLAAAACLAAAVPAAAGQCGTAMLFERMGERMGERIGEPMGGGAGIPAAAAALRSPDGTGGNETGYRARTLATDGFLIHYSLRAWHRIHLEPADSVLLRQSDSLYAVFKDRPADARDSAVYAALDKLEAPHPLYARKVAEYLEAARSYYVDTLGMRAPSSSVLSVQYNVDPSLPRRFPVDLVDIGAADSFYAGETYAITYPPPTLSISFENDFLCYTRLDSLGRISGRPISSRLDGEVIHDYAQEWELGIKVTAYHEFYHAVQFTYVPKARYHAWYELSATGMEERKAPEADDYLQYLPCVLRNPSRVPLLSTQRGTCLHVPMYGQAIFHQYLTRALDPAFDVRIWERLRQNGDSLADGLRTVFSSYGREAASLFSEYAAENFFAGGRYAFPSDSAWTTGGPYTDDFGKWPQLAVEEVDLDANPYRLINLPPLTYVALKISGGAGAAPKVLQAKGADGIVRIAVAGGIPTLERPGRSRIALTPPEEGGAVYWVISNASFANGATVEIKDPDTEFFAYPNPASVAGRTVDFSEAKDMRFPARVRIYGEAGIPLRVLDFPSAGEVMSWDLKDENGAAVRPGIYYYRVDDGAMRVLVLLR